MTLVPSETARRDTRPDAPAVTRTVRCARMRQSAETVAERSRRRTTSTCTSTGDEHPDRMKDPLARSGPRRTGRRVDLRNRPCTAPPPRAGTHLPGHSASYDRTVSRYAYGDRQGIQPPLSIPALDAPNRTRDDSHRQRGAARDLQRRTQPPSRVDPLVLTGDERRQSKRRYPGGDGSCLDPALRYDEILLRLHPRKLRIPSLATGRLHRHLIKILRRHRERSTRHERQAENPPHHGHLPYRAAHDLLRAA